MTRAVIYARYSSHSQREESIEGQLRECGAYAKREGLTVVQEYIDRALTATSDNRPAFQEMIRDSSRHDFDVVLLYALDRFARDRYDAAMYRKKLKDNGVKIISVTQPIDDSPEGILIESLLEGMAEYYSANLARGVKRGMRENALKCMAVGGPGFLGYSVDPVTKKYVIDERQAAIVREIYQLYSENKTLIEIVNICNSKGYRTNLGRPFARNSLTTILRNRRYIGIYIYDDIEIPDGMPAILDVELFEKVQFMLDKTKISRSRRKSDVEFLLTGKLYCGHCGRPMSGTSGTSAAGGKYYYYTCHRVDRAECQKVNERKDDLERFIIDYTVNSFLTADNIEVIADLVMKELKNDEYAHIMDGIRADIKEVDKRINNIMDVMEMGGSSPAMVQRLHDLESRKNDLERELDIKRRENMDFINKDIIKYWFSEVIAKGDGSIEHDRYLINTLIHSIHIFDTGNEEDPRKKVVIAFNTSGPNNAVTLECSALVGMVDRSNIYPNYYVVCGGKIILAVLDY